MRPRPASHLQPFRYQEVDHFTCTYKRITLYICGSLYIVKRRAHNLTQACDRSGMEWGRIANLDPQVRGHAAEDRGHWNTN
jgi:hypothetical protein